MRMARHQGITKSDPIPALLRSVRISEVGIPVPLVSKFEIAIHETRYDVLIRSWYKNSILACHA